MKYIKVEHGHSFLVRLVIVEKVGDDNPVHTWAIEGNDIAHLSNVVALWVPGERVTHVMTDDGRIEAPDCLAMDEAIQAVWNDMRGSVSIFGHRLKLMTAHDYLAFGGASTGSYIGEAGGYVIIWDPAEQLLIEVPCDPEEGDDHERVWKLQPGGRAPR